MTGFEKSILKYIFMYLLAFFIGRLIFVFYNIDDLSGESIPHILFAFIQGLRMDVSALSYVSPLFLSFLLLYFMTNKNIFLTLFKLFWILSIFTFFLIVIAELPIYDEWLTKLNSKAVSYLNNMSEVWRTASWSQVLATFILVPFFTFSMLVLMNKLFRKKVKEKVVYWRLILVFIFSLSVGFIGARGGFYQIPLSVSGVFYSNNNTLNFAAVNSFWNLGYGYYKDYKYDEKDKFVYFSDKQLTKILQNFDKNSGTMPSILKTKNPNIILILFESWSADLVDTLNIMYSFMPQWDRIRNEGFYFNNCYATGRHSEEGMLAVFAGFPSLANSYLMGFTNKNAQLPTITKKFAERNYQQSFFFGGDLGYANIKSFFFQNPFYKVNDEMDFPSNYTKGKLGYHDDALYAEMLKETKVSKQPFFIGGFTTSTHSPYDVPLAKFKNYTKNENEFMNSAHYADSCLGDFYQKSKLESWFDNTLFIFVSDHSHPTPIKRDYISPESHRIVFMLAGGALKEAYRGQQFSPIISQIDIPKTILKQMDYSTDDFIYSRNVLDSLYQPFAYFSDKTMQGIYNPNGFVRYSLSEDKILLNKAGEKADSIVSISKALLQKSYNQFRNL